LTSPGPATPVQQPIALGDVLALHRSLHSRITAADWATLTTEEERARVSRAFTRRCRAEAVETGAAPAALRDREIEERNDGVKRVDFLQGKTVLKELVSVEGSFQAGHPVKEPRRLILFF
ncbi:hypothetical protein B0H16DRAFT_1310789, partial [Mycena metata]